MAPHSFAGRARLKARKRVPTCRYPEYIEAEYFDAAFKTSSPLQSTPFNPKKKSFHDKTGDSATQLETLEQSTNKPFNTVCWYAKPGQDQQSLPHSGNKETKQHNAKHHSPPGSPGEKTETGCRRTRAEEIVCPWTRPCSAVLKTRPSYYPAKLKISPSDTPSVDFPIIFSRVRSWPMPRSCDTSHLEIDRLLPSVHPLHPAVVAATTGEKKKHLQSGALLLPPAHHHFAFPSFSHLLSLVSSRSSNSFLLSPTYAF